MNSLFDVRDRHIVGRLGDAEIKRRQADLINGQRVSKNGREAAGLAAESIESRNAALVEMYRRAGIAADAEPVPLAYRFDVRIFAVDHEQTQIVRSGVSIRAHGDEVEISLTGAGGKRFE